MPVYRQPEITASEVFEEFLKISSQDRATMGMSDKDFPPNELFLRHIAEYVIISRGMSAAVESSPQAADSADRKLFLDFMELRKNHALNRIEEQGSALARDWHLANSAKFKTPEDILTLMKFRGEYDVNLAKCVINYLETGDDSFLEERNLCAVATEVSLQYDRHFNRHARAFGMEDTYQLEIRGGEAGSYILAIAQDHEIDLIRAIIEEYVPDWKGKFVFSPPDTPTP